MQVLEQHAAGSHVIDMARTAAAAVGRMASGLQDRSILLTTLAVLGAISGLLIAALLSRDPREALAYTVACVMIGGSIALGLRGREVDRTSAGARAPTEIDQQMRSVAHDLKAPLLMVTSYLELIADGAFGAVSDDVRAALTRAAEVSERAQTVIDSTLRRDDPATTMLTRLAPVDLNRVVSDVVGALNCSMRERQANVAIEGRLPSVMGEDAAMFRVLENLLQNSIKFCPTGTTPQIAVRARRLDAHTVELTISDNGPGIPDDAERLIYRGARGRNALGVPGHGIGLSTVARLVTRMGGTVRFESPTEGGTVVRLTLRGA